MKYERFEDLPAWKAAMELGHSVYTFTKDRFFRQPGDLCDQLRRASLSVSNNIAEGFERGSTSELLAFLYIARGSAGEVRSMLHFIDGLPNSSHLKAETSKLKSMAESCSRQIRAWTDKLQNTDIKGQRHLNNRTRSNYDAKRNSTEFQKQLDGILHQAHPEIYPGPREG